MYRNRKVFFMASEASWPVPEVHSLYPDAKNVTETGAESRAGSGGGQGRGRRSPLKFTSGGALIGPAGLVRKMLALTYQGDCWNDQFVYTMAFLDPILWWVDPRNGTTRVGSKHQTTAEPGAGEGSGIPKDAQPLIGLDYLASLFVSLSHSPESKCEVQGERGKQSVTYVATGGHPLILHKNGNDNEKRFNGPTLEHYACIFGYGGVLASAIATGDECRVDGASLLSKVPTRLLVVLCHCPPLAPIPRFRLSLCSCPTRAVLLLQRHLCRNPATGHPSCLP